MSKPDLKDRDFMYKLIIGYDGFLPTLAWIDNQPEPANVFRQLFYDGHQQLAVNLSSTLGLSQQPPPPSDKLFRLVTVAKQFVDEPDTSKDKDSPLFQVSPNSTMLFLP